MRVRVARTKSNMVKWRLKNEEDDKCDCDECQTDEHLLIGTKNPAICSMDDLIQANQNAIDMATH